MREVVNMQIDREIIDLTHELNVSASRYYNGYEPTLSDEQYDIMLNRLEELEKQMGVRLPNSPTKRVGFTVLDSIPKKKLPRKMLSLDKIKNDVDALVKWKGLHRIAMSLKMDGLSCMLEYKDGDLIGCYTRGNGVEGSDVTDMVKCLPSVPSRLKNGNTVLVVGEIIIRNDRFTIINKERIESGESEFANTRNLASGTLLSLDTKLGRHRGLEFVAFDAYGDITCGENPIVVCQQDRLLNLEIHKFNVAPYTMIDCMENIEHDIDVLKQVAENMGYPIDGMVATYDSDEVRAKCKPTEKYPTHSIAYKFKDEYEESVLRDIEWSISRTGVLTPVAIFDTVLIDGTEVSRANVHNVSMLRLLELGIGDSVKVIKANQIIPQILENDTRSDSYELPTSCPYCGAEVAIQGENSLELACVNENCSEQQMLRINHFLSKDALNAKGVSEKILKKLMSFGEVKNLYDVLELSNKREHLIKKNYPSLGRKTINNICDAIEQSCNTTLDRFLIGLGIDGLGRKASKDIASKYVTVDNMMDNISVLGLKTIGGIDSMAVSLFNDITNESDNIERLLQYVKFEEVSQETVGNSLEGKVFVFTGKTGEFKNRKEVEIFITSNGAKMLNSVTSKTSYLICNAVESSSKYKKAVELGIEIITDKQLKKMVK